MARPMLYVGAFLLLCQTASADHPCQTEVASACADRPGSDVGACLKDPEEHDSPIEISSGCTDFMALNKACSADLEEFCDGNHFHDDTLLCLTKWTPTDHLSEKCQGVLKWAVPQEEGADGETVTDELGLSDADYAEKKEWQRKRREGRGDAIERMKMKEEDRKKEEDRTALEEFKEKDPEGYAQMIEQQKEEARQQREFKKRERAQAAAMERAKRKAAGLSEEDEDVKTTKGAGSTKKAKSKGSWTYTIISLLVIGGIGALIYVFITSQASGARTAKKATKKKRG